jgi:Na+-driven multidrug efflux pump
LLLRRLKSLFRVKGIWAGMIGGTAVQTLILAIITVRCDWEKEVSY